MNDEFDLGLEFVEANAEETGLPEASFDLAFSQYGASIWWDPARSVPEAARLLRPGGELLFLRGSTLSVLCAPDDGPTTERLVRPQQGLYRLDRPETDADEAGGEFHLGTRVLFRILRASGFELLDLVELFAPEDAVWRARKALACEADRRARAGFAGAAV